MLSITAKYGDWEVFIRFLEYTPHHYEKEHFYLAVKGGNANILRHAIEKLNERPDERYNYLSMAADHNNTEMVALLLPFMSEEFRYNKI